MAAIAHETTGIPVLPRHPTRFRPMVLNVAQGSGGGAETALRRILLVVSRPDDRLDWLVVSPEGSSLQSFCRELDIPWRPWTARRDSFMQNLKAWLGLMRNTPNPLPRPIFAWGARSFEWAKLLAVVKHSLAYGRLADHPRVSFHSRARQCIVRAAANRLKVCVVPSLALDQACEQLGWRVPRQVIYNIFQPMPASSCVGHTQVEVGFLGGDSLLKGRQVLPGWMLRLRELPVHWHIYGELSGESSSWQKEVTSASGGRCSFHGRRSPESIYTKLSLVVHPSREFDASPNVLMEAASAGVPVVASDVGGSREFVLHGKTGFLFPPAEPELGEEWLRRLVEQTGLRLQLGSQTSDFFHEFTRNHDAAAAYRKLWNVPTGSQIDVTPIQSSG